jgi:hypothetical protein
MTHNDLDSTSSSPLRWAAILLFIGLPWIIILLLRLVPDIPDEFHEKMEAFERRPRLDTIVVGDSRVMRLSEDHFRTRGWSLFNMGFSGLSPDDVEMALHFALAHRPIRRAVIGVSFENMTQSFPYEFSRYRDRYTKPLGSYIEDTRQVNASVEIEKPKKFKSMDKIKNLFSDGSFQEIADIAVAKVDSFFNKRIRNSSSNLHMLLSILEIKPLYPNILPDGTIAYRHIHEDIKYGRYDFRRNRNVDKYWGRKDSEVRYLERGTLSESSKDVYRRIFSTLKSRGIPAVVFETGKLPEYQQRIDSDPLLNRLQSEWRAFYRDQQSSCLRFLDFYSLDGVYDPNDFFDATHFIGMTEGRLAEKVVAELLSVETDCISTSIDRSAVKKVGK